ncbi:MAG: TRAP transporter substrate-binding protein [Moorellales bacterium]
MRNRKRLWWISLLVAASLILVSLAGCGKGSQGQAPATGEQQGAGGSAPAQQTITLRFANYYAPESGPGKLGQEFCQDIERVTNGRVKIEYYPGGTLLTAPKMYDGVAQGIADIGLANLSYTFGRFKQTEVLDLPLGFPNAWVAGHVAQDFLKQFQPKEWEQTHVLVLTSTPANNVVTVNRPVRKLEDLKGLTLRGTGYIGKLVEALGATPRPVPMAEAYDNLTKKVIDGLMVNYETMIVFKLGEVTKYITEAWPLGQVYTFYVVMNKDTWNKLPADIQEAITKYVDEEFHEKMVNMWNELGLKGLEYVQQNGLEIIQLPPDEVQRWKQAADRVVEDYVKSMVAAGYQESEVRGWIDFARQRIDYWTKKQIELGVKSDTGPAEVAVQKQLK